MKRMLRQTGVIARRDFIATVFTPTFLLFLLAPFFMLGFGLVGGLGASRLASGAVERAQLAVIATSADAAKLRDADSSLRPTFHPEQRPAPLRFVAPAGDPATQARALIEEKDSEVYAVLHGPLERPIILREASTERSAPYLAALAEQALRTQRAGLPEGARLSRARTETIARDAPSRAGRQGLGFGAVFVIFFLTLLLAGQSVGMLAEEKGNKVIEILAAAAPLESVFLGKLVGMFGVALLFVAFWGLLATQGLQMLPAEALEGIAFAPAIGAPAFFLLAGLYFTMAYLLLGAVFLGLGAQASTVREIQMLSLPITIFQVAMFGLASAAASSPDSTLARIAEIFPFSSPFAMAARGATDASLWPHLLALAWQLFWVALTILVGARLFRRGVLKSGSAGLFKRRKQWQPATE